MSSNYSGSNIKHLEGLEAVRHRSDMYVGAIDGALFHMTKEILDNSVDEFINDYGTKVVIDLDLQKEIITIKDDGRGLPIDIHPDKKIPTIELLFTSLHSSGKFDKNAFKVSAGKNGVGASVVNALSSYMMVKSIREGYEYYIEFENGGKIKTPFKKVKTKYPKSYSGTEVTFKPDPEVLKEYVKFDKDQIRDNLIQRAYCNADLRIEYNVTDEDGKKKDEVFHFPEGIEALVKDETNKRLTQVYHFEKEIDGDIYEVALTYTNTDKEEIVSFVNGIQTARGTHEQGLKTGITTIINKFITDNNLLTKGIDKSSITGDDVRAGLFAVINCKLSNPTYRSQTKDDLSNPEANSNMRKLMSDKFKGIVEANDKEFKTVGKRIVQFAKGRLNASKYREKVVSVNSNNAGLQFSPKFTDCLSNNPEETELFIAEGDSAVGSINDGRIAEIQAVFPLKGKPKQSHSSSLTSLLKNDEISELIKIIFGTNDVKNIDYDKVRYHKIIITSDADDDGLHIQALLIDLFYTHFPELIKRGYIYVAQPPKYSYNEKGKFHYIKNDKELVDFEYKISSKKLKLENANLKDLINVKDNYLDVFNNICSDMSVSDKFLDRFILFNEDEEDINEVLESMELYIDDKDNITGIYDNIWHDVNLDDLINSIGLLINILEIDYLINFDYDGGKEKGSLSPYNMLKFINKKFKFEYNYFKGLGEVNASELFETTLDPKRRDLIKVNESKSDEAIKMLDDLFGNKTDSRRELLNKYYQTV
ncbi:DNA gyrase subunit B [Staphylococcus phage MarsHill]|nr:DNA gyrase subunit B [Staphylococcus phage MarsHill]